jgi:glycosyltransferase involved in cell wall biosynthesis
MIALHVGQIGRRKGVFDLLRALRRLRDEQLSVRLVAVGPSELPGELDAALALRAELKLEDAVEFTGPLQGEALYRQYESADCFVLPSYIEGLPVVLHEAGAFSLPVITTPVGAIPELVRDGANGLVVAPGNVEQIAGALRMLATDPALRERLGRQLRADVAAFHPDRVTERIADAVWATLGPAWKA